MKRLLTIISVLTLVLTGCHPDPFADAVIRPNPAYVGENVYFNNYSVNASYIEWDFGDGYVSSDFNPVHSYDIPGFYDVTLKAFGKKSSVDVAVYEIEVIGSSVKIIVKEWYQEYVVPGASVILYPTYQDWKAQTNMVEELITNNIGECIFEGLRFQRYYVDVWEANHDNYLLEEEFGTQYIETQVLDPALENTFVAWVDYYAPAAKKSATFAPEERRQKRALPVEVQNAPRGLKENQFSEPKK